MSKILVFGAGSIGVYLGTKLYAAGHEVTLYGRRKLQSLRDPITINHKLYPLPPRIYQLQGSAYDVILVTTKLYDAQAAAKLIRQHYWHPNLVAFIQNGLVNHQFYADISDYPGFLTVTVFNAYHLQANQISVMESQKGLQVENTEVGQQLVSIFNAAEIRCTVTTEVTQTRCRKLIANAALNALSAIEKKNIGEVMADPHLKQIVDRLILESWQVLSTEHQLPPVAVIQEEIYHLATQVKFHYSSMYQDLISGRRTEIDFLNGLIIELGHKKGIPTPTHCQIYQRICEVESVDHAYSTVALC
ncbi:MAG: ketopantoate reductase family protein [Spirulina sp. SIO3F2]|nr:ketopantoate reductase family protein [Spirulina sp. SIO3F2]